jgi:MoaA/NifB/PqqE/SkfB family radical SAM enzyme
MNTRQLIQTVVRRRRWLFTRLSARKLWNLVTTSVEFAMQRETLVSKPAFVKIDISPICNLRCTVCVHADPGESPLLQEQVFGKEHRMSPEQFRGIIDAIKDHTTAVSLYTWGDPLTHPQLPELCEIACSAGLQVHASTNYSFKWSDEKVRELVDSGLTHLTVCVDGLSQEKYEKTRVGGRIDWVLDNLERTIQFRNESKRQFPLVEVQYIQYQHNLDEIEPARTRCNELGVDEFASFWGALHNYADREPENYEIKGPKPNGALPGCYWPHYSMVVKWNGDVIPCCEHRMASQHAPSRDARSFGNIFEKPLSEIWNGPAYQQARRLVSKPERSETEPELKKNFCDGCFVIFDTTVRDTARWASEHQWEEVYSSDESRPGRSVRKPKSETGLPF